jgi:hypothetical protein
MEPHRTLKRSLAGIVLIALAMEFSLLLSGARILISERIVHPGQQFVVKGWGDLGKASQASLACRYFDGRALRFNVFWYSPSNVVGRDSCPFILGLDY